MINGTTVSEKHAALIALQRNLVQQCKAAGLPSRAPTEEMCKDQLLLSVSDKTYAILKTIVTDRGLKFLTYKEVLDTPLEAENRHTYQLPIITRVDAIRNPPRNNLDTNDYENDTPELLQSL